MERIIGLKQPLKRAQLQGESLNHFKNELSDFLGEIGKPVTKDETLDQIMQRFEVEFSILQNKMDALENEFMTPSCALNVIKSLNAEAPKLNIAIPKQEDLVKTVMEIFKKLKIDSNTWNDQKKQIIAAQNAAAAAQNAAASMGRPNQQDVTPAFASVEPRKDGKKRLMPLMVS